MGAEAIKELLATHRPRRSSSSEELRIEMRDRHQRGQAPEGGQAAASVVDAFRNSSGHQAGVDDSGRHPGAFRRSCGRSCRSTAAASRAQRPERPLPAGDQPQQSPEEACSSCAAPEVIVRNEKRMLQGGGRRPVRQRPPRPCRSRARTTGRSSRCPTLLKRQVRAGSARTCSASASTTRAVRSSWSVRSCVSTSVGLPKKMALELFKPFIYNRLEAQKQLVGDDQEPPSEMVERLRSTRCGTPWRR